MKKYLLFFWCLFISLSSYAQSADKSNKGWTITNPFEFKVFIENKGQFKSSEIIRDKVTTDNDSIFYYARHFGVDIYFTSSGVTYKHTEIERLPEEEREREEKEAKREHWEEENEEAVVNEFFLAMNLVGANSDVEIYGVEKVHNYFTYGDLSDVTGKSMLRADAFKKIVYRNIYPGIDMEYLFPEGKEGIKYNFVVHPGADVSKIKMNYTEARSITLDAGEIKIESDFGEFIDHAPVVFYEEGGSIKASFELKDNIVSFKLNRNQVENSKETIIIDPWVTVPVFINNDNAYDVDWDYNGNTYIYGGSGVFQLSKINSSGNIQWTYLPTGISYGDFCVDRNTGNSFICEGFNLEVGCRMAKVNSSGSQTLTYPGSLKVNEMWNIAFNSCTGQGIIGCGNTDSTYQAATFDTSLTVITPVNIASTTISYVDIISFTADGTDAYFLTIKNEDWYENMLIKCPLGTLAPTEYMVPTTCDFEEIYSIQYNNTYSFYAPGTNSYNGMAKSLNYLYIYDGKLITRWNPDNGNFIDSVFVDTAQFLCGGIAVDACDNVFVGALNGVRQYDAMLNYVTTANTPGSVYDVKIGLGNQIIACGYEFAAALDLFSTCPPSVSSTITTTASNCNADDGTATVIASGGSPPYNYLWLPGGQTTATATGLAPGDYTMLMWNTSGCAYSIIDSVSIAGLHRQSLSATPVVCFGDTNGAASITPAGGSEPYTYLWTPSGQTTASISGLSGGTYTVIVTDSDGCQVIDSILIAAPSSLLSAEYYSENICNGEPGRAGVLHYTIQGGMAPYSVTWSTGQIGYYLNNISSPGDYAATLADAHGCSVSYDMSVAEIPRWYISSIDVVTDCWGSSQGIGSINIHFTEDSLFDLTFTWEDGYHIFPYSDDSILTDLNAGVYECRITDSENCIDTTIYIQVPQYPLIYDNPIEQNPTCGINNGIITSQPYGGVPPYSFLWDDGQTTQTMYGIGPGSYTGIVTDSVGCFITTGGTLDSISGSGMNILINQNGDTLYATTAPNYQWYFNDTLIPGATSQNYQLTESGYYYVVTTEGNCTDTSNVIETTCLCVGIRENEFAKGIFIYPNPTDNKVTVEIQKAKGIYELYDANGKLLLKGAIKKTKFTIDLSIYTKGVYFVRIIEGEQQMNRKIIRE